MSTYQQPDAHGHFGPYGGSFVSETLTHAINELSAAYEHYRHDPEFQAELAALQRDGRSTIQKLAQALRRDASRPTASSALVAPEMARRKEPLESYPLDTMVMVGSMSRKGRPVALVRVDNLLYQVSPGMYLGQNYGKITKVTETEVVLREIVQDPTGEWVERTATLQLQERSK